jgi:hypothetical protein
MPTNITTLIPDDALIFDVAREAAAKGVQIISNGLRFALATSVPQGWHAVPVVFKTAH